MSKKGIAKVVAMGLFVGGIAFAGVNYDGGEAINNITDKTTELQGRFNEATSDITFLQKEFNALNGLYAKDMLQADEEISKLLSRSLDFKDQINALQAEIESGNTDNTTAQSEIQAEITRLENALTEANNDIAELELHIATIEAETQYDPVDKEAFTAEDLTMLHESNFVSLDAYNLDFDKAIQYADTAIAVSDGFSTRDYPFEIVGVSTFNVKGKKVLSYTVSADSYRGFDRISGGSIANTRSEQGVIRDLFGEGVTVYFVIEGGQSHPFSLSNNTKERF